MSKLNALSMYSFSRKGPVIDIADDKEHRFPYMLGVELELENFQNDADRIPVGWTTHVDDSLRNGIEFVFKAGTSGHKAIGVVSNFYKQTYRWTNGPRTSTHIHVNLSDMTVGQVRAMFCVSYALEDALFRALDAKRKYCGYCMPLSEMSDKRLASFLTVDDTRQFTQSMGGNNAEKYYGFNVNSVSKHGTVEFRYFPGGPKEDELLSWMDYCTQVRTAGQTTDLDGLLAIDSPAVFEQWLLRFFPVWGQKFIDQVGAEFMYEQLAEVLAILPHESQGEQRQEPLVFITKPLAKFVNTTLLTEQAQRDYFNARVVPIGAMTENEWHVRIATARQQQEGGMSNLVASWDDPPIAALRAPPRPSAYRANNVNVGAAMDAFIQNNPRFQPPGAERELTRVERDRVSHQASKLAERNNEVIRLKAVFAASSRTDNNGRDREAAFNAYSQMYTAKKNIYVDYLKRSILNGVWDAANNAAPPANLIRGI